MAEETPQRATPATPVSTSAPNPKEVQAQKAQGQQDTPAQTGQQTSPGAGGPSERERALEEQVTKLKAQLKEAKAASAGPESPGGRGRFVEEDPRQAQHIEAFNTDGPLKVKESGGNKFRVVTPVHHDGELFIPEEGKTFGADKFGGEENVARLVQAGAVELVQRADEPMLVWENYSEPDNRPAADMAGDPNTAQYRLDLGTPEPTNIPKTTAPAAPPPDTLKVQPSPARAIAGQQARKA
jgi:hypothetical protein